MHASSTVRCQHRESKHTHSHAHGSAQGPLHGINTRFGRAGEGGSCRQSTTSPYLRQRVSRVRRHWDGVTHVNSLAFTADAFERQRLGESGGIDLTSCTPLSSESTLHSKLQASNPTTAFATYYLQLYCCGGQNVNRFHTGAVIAAGSTVHFKLDIACVQNESMYSNRCGHAYGIGNDTYENSPIDTCHTQIHKHKDMHKHMHKHIYTCKCKIDMKYDLPTSIQLAYQGAGWQIQATGCPRARPRSCSAPSWR